MGVQVLPFTAPKSKKHWPQTVSSWLSVLNLNLNFYMWDSAKWPAVLQTLSRERPGGREGEEGSSRPRGFFCFGGTASEDEAAGEVTGEDVVTGGMTGSEGNKSQEWNLMNYGNRHKKRRRSRWAPRREGRKTLSSIREIIQNAFLSPVSVSWPSPSVLSSSAGCWTPTPASMQGGGGLSTMVGGGSGSPESQISSGTWMEEHSAPP